MAGTMRRHNLARSRRTQFGQRVAVLAHVDVRHLDVRRRQDGGIHHQFGIQILNTAEAE